VICLENIRPTDTVG